MYYHQREYLRRRRITTSAYTQRTLYLLAVVGPIVEDRLSIQMKIANEEFTTYEHEVYLIYYRISHRVPEAFLIDIVLKYVMEILKKLMRTCLYVYVLT